MATHKKFIWTLGALLMTARPAAAQVDPLLFLKTAIPNVIFMVDTSSRMQRNAPTDPSTVATSLSTSNYYDPWLYTRTGALWEGGIGVSAANTTLKYRRQYVSLTYANGGGDKYNATTIQTLGDSAANAAAYARFDAPTRLAIARAAMYQALAENQTVARFGLVKMRQTGAAAATQGNSTPVAVSDLSQQITETGAINGRWHISRPTITNGTKNGTSSNAGVVVVAADNASANTTLATTLAKDVRAAGALFPAGDDDFTNVDAPMKLLIDDARVEAARLIGLSGDPTCRCTVAIMIVGGGEGTTTAGMTNNSLATAASNFLAISGRRVPIYVIALAPPATDVVGLQAVASTTGGRYFGITKAQIDAALASPTQIATATNGTAPTGTVVVPEVVKAINIAISHAFASSTDLNTAPTLSLPYGPLTEFQVTSPIIGTVNLDHGVDITGAALVPDSANILDQASNKIPQRSNLLITAGFSMPGFDGKLRGFRVYKPVADASKPSGYNFISDGKALWVACVPGAGCAAEPDNTKRNLYTATAAGTLIKFDVANVATLAPLMNLTEADATAVINDVRALPLGPIFDSTPAIMNPPSLDPPPDEIYPGFAEANKKRRSIIWVGTNSGILEGIDARFGVEVWGFIPLNLLPKLRTLRDGQPVGAPDFFVDSSAKLADVRYDDAWHTHMIIGEGPGGTYYQSFDVTMANQASALGGTEPDSAATLAQVLNYFSDVNRITLNWAFPSYSTFNPAIAPYGDIAVTASAVEKSVGQTWSDPAVGPIVNDTGPYAVMVGSGFMKYSVEQQANRGGVRAGTTFYVLNAKTGAVYASNTVTNDTNSETNSDCRTDNGTNGCKNIRNALQTDPVATGPSDSRFVTKVYLADLDGNIWRFDLGLNGSSIPTIPTRTKLYAAGADQPIFNSLATVNVGGTQQYVFFGTGSDLLPQTDKNTIHRMLAVLDNGATGTKTFEKLLTKTASGNNVLTDERVTAFPAVAGDIVFFTTTLLNQLCLAPAANLYAFTFVGGPAYDSNNSGSINNQDVPLVRTVAGVRATAPYIVDQHLVFGVGGNVSVFGDSADYNNGIGQAGVRILSWREIR